MFLRQKLFGNPTQMVATSAAGKSVSSSSRVVAAKAYMPAKIMNNAQFRGISSHLKAFATIDPENLSASDKGFNLVGGEWTSPN